LCEDHVGLQGNQLFRDHPRPVNIVGGPTNIHPQVAAATLYRMRAEAAQ
jgi:hypothetical protein